MTSKASFKEDHTFYQFVSTALPERAIRFLRYLIAGYKVRGPLIGIPKPTSLSNIQRRHVIESSQPDGSLSAYMPAD
jgi:hypothetical protein